MAVSMADITKLRKMTGAGMMDCKNALNDAEVGFALQSDDNGKVTGSLSQNAAFRSFTV